MYTAQFIYSIVFLQIVGNYLKISLAIPSPSFYISFQRSKNLSTEEWAEFKGDMPDLKEFTVCHWEKLSSFNDQINTIWGYCFKNKGMEEIDCFQLMSSLIPSTANRQTEIHSTFDYHYKNTTNKFRGFIELRNKTMPYKHRKWHHYCWLYSNITGVNAFYWNGNMIANMTVPEQSRTIWRGTQNEIETAFIIGQEQDQIKGGYQRTQVFTGDIAEMNIWDYHLSQESIQTMAKCKTVLRGNVKSWEFQNLKINKAIVVNISEANMFCLPERRLIIFPKRRPLNLAKQICTTHGGKLATPYSDEENDEILEVVKKHYSTCIDAKDTEKRNWGKLVWLGLKRSNAVWYDAKGDDLIRPINYSRWLTTYYKDNVDCAYLQSDGSWYYGLSGGCSSENLCTICSVEDTPVFTFKGLCYASVIDYNYYINVDSNHEIKDYEGYKHNKISKDQYGVWNSNSSSFRISLISDDNTSFPIGRQNWNYFDQNCKDSDTKYLTLSQCEFGLQFSCHSGHCIDVEKKCDGHTDCADHSDEENCSYIRIPHFYKQTEPPSTNMSYQVVIERINHIDTIEMVIELTNVVIMQWYDGRLSYTNLRNRTNHLISDDTAKQVWTPLNRLVHEKALIGRTHIGESKLYIQEEESSASMDASNAFEDRLFHGSNNILLARQRARLTYDCTFELRSFPFDTQICKFKSHIVSGKDFTQRFISKQDSVKYLGPKIVNDFEIQKIETVSGVNENHTYFMFIITMDRNYSSQLISIFFPTWLIWFLAYLTFFIDLKNFNNRFMGSVTSLLVLASLLNSMQSSLPKTAYFKYVDCWFLWYIANSIFMIATHVLLDNISRAKNGTSKIMSMLGNDDDDLERYKSKQKRMNRIAIIVYPTLVIPFNIAYFTLQLM